MSATARVGEIFQQKNVRAAEAFGSRSLGKSPVVVGGTGQKVSQAPKAQPAPTKPFADAFKTMEKDSIPARAKQIEGVDEDLPSITLVKDPNARKSVPLASLSSSASKVPTPARINALKDALARAMETKKEPVQISQSPQPPEVPEEVLKKTLKVD
jgi:hypothetical protein